VTTNPSSQTVTAGSSYSFSAAATGSPSPTVQWQLSTDGGATFTDLAGETSTTYTATASISVDGYQFRAVFTNASGTATTSAATLTVQTVPTVSTNPSDTTVLVGTPYSFSAAGSGTPAPSVQWQLSTDGGATFTDISGATSTTYTATAVATDNGHQFRAVFTNPAGTATTTAATLTVATTATAPVITSAVAGNASVTVTWTASSPSPASYTVSSKRGTLVGPTCTTTGTSCVVSGLTNGLSYTFKVTANYGTTTTVSASSAAVIPRIITDLVAGNSAPVSAYRSGTGSGVTAGSPFTVTESVTNNGTQAAPAKMVITVTNATESSISTDPGLVCDPLTPVGAGFTQTCNVALLAPGATLSAQVSLNPQPLPPVLSLIAVKNVVSLPVTVPSTYLDPVKTNNTVAKKVKVYDRDDLVATFSGAPSVLRSGQYVASGSITNNGPDPVFGKFTITVANALEASGGFTADAGLSCAAPVVNGAGTGFSRVCTTVAPLASGGSLSVQLTLVPNPTLTVHTFTVTAAAASVGGYVVDANPLNNKQVLRVAIV